MGTFLNVILSTVCEKRKISRLSFERILI